MNSETGNRFARYACAILLAITLLGLPASAASISYGDFAIGGTDLSFLDVKESSSTDAVPLYGAPTPYFIGLDFNPTGFISSSSDGSSDVTDGQLNFMVESSGSDSIPSLTIAEGGHYTLSGAGTPVTQVGAGMAAQIEVVAVDHVALDTPFSFFLNDSVQYSLPSDSGIIQPWNTAITADLEGELVARGIDFHSGVTKISVVVDNTLFAISEQGTVASIVKTDFDTNLVPEPASMVLVSIALCGIGLLRSRA